MSNRTSKDACDMALRLSRGGGGMGGLAGRAGDRYVDGLIRELAAMMDSLSNEAKEIGNTMQMYEREIIRMKAKLGEI